jgi:hypothetical protein
MNSERLISKYRSVYQDFFTECQTVASLPLVFDWTGNNGISTVCIKQKMPLRIYLGLSSNPNP